MILRDSKATDVEFKDSTHLYQIAVGTATVTRSLAVGLQMLPLIVCWSTASVTLSIQGTSGGAVVSQSFAISPSAAGPLGAFTGPLTNPPWYQEWQGILFDAGTPVTVSGSTGGVNATVALRVLSAQR